MSEESPKPRKPRKPSKKKVTEALDKHLAPQQKFNKPKKPRNKRFKIVECDVETFGALIPDVHGSYGFVYKVTIATSIGTRYYVGSKAFDKAGEWRNYCTSSDIVQRLIATSRVLPDTCRVTFEVLEYAPSLTMLKIRENVRMRGLYALVGKGRIINVADPFGMSLRTGKNLRK